MVSSYGPNAVSPLIAIMSGLFCTCGGCGSVNIAKHGLRLVNWSRSRSGHYVLTSAEVVTKRWSVIGLEVNSDSNRRAAKADVCGSAASSCEVSCVYLCALTCGVDRDPPGKCLVV